MKTEMEKQEHEHQECSAKVSVKHSKELKDLGKRRTGSLLEQSRVCVSMFLHGSIYLFVYQSINHAQRCPTARSWLWSTRGSRICSRNIKECRRTMRSSWRLQRRAEFRAWRSWRRRTRPSCRRRLSSWLRLVNRSRWWSGCDTTWNH